MITLFERGEPNELKVFKSDQMKMFCITTAEVLGLHRI